MRGSAFVESSSFVWVFGLFCFFPLFVSRLDGVCDEAFCGSVNDPAAEATVSLSRVLRESDAALVVRSGRPSGTDEKQLASDFRPHCSAADDIIHKKRCPPATTARMYAVVQ